MKVYKLSVIAALLFLISCQEPISNKITVRGETMGTTYSLIVFDADEKALKQQCDSLLLEINRSLSTYIPESTISRINRCDNDCRVDEHFEKVFLQSQKVHQQSEGKFDPTVMPLVNAWGFGYTDREEPPDSAEVDSLLSFVGFEKCRLSQKRLLKDDPGLSIDFGGIAKGYGVDVLVDFLRKQGFVDVLVEIGGEVRTMGEKPDNQDWLIAIEKPIEGGSISNREIQNTIALKNAAMASSGNYRNFYNYEGQPIAHEIDPATGYPLIGSLLACSVIADECMLADAWATALMLCSAEEAKVMVERVTEIEALLIFKQDGEIQTYSSAGFPELQEY